MKYKINWQNIDGVFAVPDIIAEKHLKLASGVALKVILLILKYKDSCDLAFIKSTLNVDDDAIEDAISYWKQLDVLVQDNKISDKQAVNPVKNIHIADNPPKIKEVKSAPTRTITPKEISERIESSPETAFLFTSAESTFGRILNHTEHRSLIWITDYLGLPPDVILMLIEYCKSINKLSIRYIETVAVAWQERGIISHDLAAIEIQQMINSHTLSRQVASKLGINRTLISKEQNYVNQWSAKGITLDMIYCAYEKTVESTGKLNFPYMHKIITSWNENGLKTLEDVDNYDKKYKDSKPEQKKKSQQKQDNSTHSYDLDKFDAFALNHTPKINGGE